MSYVRKHFQTIVVAMITAAVTAGAPAIAHGVKHALFAHDSEKVDGLSASTKPKPGQLLALNADKRLSAGLADVSSLDGGKCRRSGRNGLIDVINLPISAVLVGSIVGTDTQADTNINCVVSDDLEPNNTENNAYPIPSTTTSVSEVTVFPVSDGDWYRSTRFTAGIRIFFTRPGISMDVYEDDVLVNDDTTCWLNDDPGVEHEYELHVTGSTIGIYAFQYFNGSCP